MKLDNIEARDLILSIKTILELEYDVDITPNMYDPHKMQYKISIAIMEKIENSNDLKKRFIITVDDLKDRKF